MVKAWFDDRVLSQSEQTRPCTQVASLLSVVFVCTTRCPSQPCEACVRQLHALRGQNSVPWDLECREASYFDTSI